MFPINHGPNNEKQIKKAIITTEINIHFGHQGKHT